MDYNKTEDAIFKRAMEIFKDGAIKFFGINENIISAANIEIKNIDIKTNAMDYLFITDKGEYIHFEFQTTNKVDDMARFMYYDASLYYKEKRKIQTIVVYSSEIKESISKLNCGSLNYEVKAFYMINIDGDKKYNTLKNKIEKGEELSTEDIVMITFIPLMKSTLDKAERAMNSLNLTKEIKDEGLRTDCVTLLYALFDKFADSELKRKFREVFTMTEIGKMIYEDGMKEGLKEGLKEGEAKGASKGKAELLIKQLVKKFKKVPEEYKVKIRELSEETIEIIGTDIFELNDLEELEKYM